MFTSMINNKIFVTLRLPQNEVFTLFSGYHLSPSKPTRKDYTNIKITYPYYELIVFTLLDAELVVIWWLVKPDLSLKYWTSPSMPKKR